MEDGSSDGPVYGLFEGISDGPVVGLKDGMPDGKEERFTEGISEGEDEGFFEGTSNGLYIPCVINTTIQANHNHYSLLLCFGPVDFSLLAV